jgi:hypothetical protein
MKNIGISNTLMQVKLFIEKSFKASKEELVIQNDRFIRIEEKEEALSGNI